jgi:thioredoxin-like negative regulator of GroEL
VWPFRRRQFDKRRALEKADRARIGGRTRKAIAVYREVLRHDPKDAAVHGKLAPLLADAGDVEEALASFRAAAEGHLAAGFVDRAISVKLQAAARFPRRVELVEEIVALHLDRGHRGDAFKTLTDGRERLRRPSDRPLAIRLLVQGLELQPWNASVTFDLARLYVKVGARERGLDLLEALADHVPGQARRARRAQFLLAPSVRRLWRWVVGGPSHQLTA